MSRPRFAQTVAAAATLMLALSGSIARAAVDRCLAVASLPGVTYAALTPRSIIRVQAPSGGGGADVGAKLQANEVRLTYVGHSTFDIESPDGVRIATDYNDYVRSIDAPDIATMNRAHSSHFTDVPSASIKHVLRGWNPAGGQARHDVEFRDVHVRNVATNIRGSDGGASYGAYGNSIFIFQMAGLCIGHLGHLHHTLTAEQLMAIGQLDVVLVPVDGGYTLDLPGMIEVMQTLRARLIVPMHYFSDFTLNRFLDRVRGEWPIEMSKASSVIVSQRTLPAKTTILVLPPS